MLILVLKVGIGTSLSLRSDFLFQNVIFFRFGTATSVSHTKWWKKNSRERLTPPLPPLILDLPIRPGRDGCFQYWNIVLKWRTCTLVCQNTKQNLKLTCRHINRRTYKPEAHIFILNFSLNSRCPQLGEGNDIHPEYNGCREISLILKKYGGGLYDGMSA